MTQVVTISDKAAERLKGLLQNEGKPDFGLRLKVVGGGCSGHSYAMDFEEKAAEGDQVYEGKGVKVFVDPESDKLCDGSEVDYVDALTGAGFTIKNPKAKGSCGCGSSFTV